MSDLQLAGGLTSGERDSARADVRQLLTDTLTVRRFTSANNATGARTVVAETTGWRGRVYARPGEGPLLATAVGLSPPEAHLAVLEFDASPRPGDEIEASEWAGMVFACETVRQVRHDEVVETWWEAELRRVR